MSIPAAVKIGGMIAAAGAALVSTAWMLAWPPDPTPTPFAAAWVQDASCPPPPEPGPDHDVVDRAAFDPATVEPPEPDEDVSWEHRHFRVRVAIDSNLSTRDQGVDVQQAKPAGGDLNELHKYIESATVEKGELRVITGETDGFCGSETQFRVRMDADGKLAADVSSYTFRDAGPPFNFPRTDLTGRITLSESTWTPGRNVWIAYELSGVSQNRRFTTHETLHPRIN